MGRLPKDPADRKSRERQVTAPLDEQERANLDRLSIELRLSAAGVVRQALGELYERVFPKGKR